MKQDLEYNTSADGNLAHNQTINMLSPIALCIDVRCNLEHQGTLGSALQLPNLLIIEYYYIYSCCKISLLQLRDTAGKYGEQRVNLSSQRKKGLEKRTHLAIK